MNYIPDDSIPKPLYDALVKSNEAYYEDLKEYLRGKSFTKHYGATTLIGAPQKSQLFKRHQHEIWVRPIKDLWPAFIGSCIHFILETEAKKNPNNIVEFRQGVDFGFKDNVTIHCHGMLDLYERDTQYIEDYKITRPESLLYDKTEHRMQLNVLRYFAEMNGYKVKGIRDVYMFPHLSKRDIGKEGYPTQNAVRVEVPLLPLKEVEEFIRKRAWAHYENEDRKDKDLTPCSDSDRWIRESIYKIYLRKKTAKKGETPDFSSKAAHTFFSKAETQAFLDETQLTDDEMLVKELKGEPKGCEYCKGAPFCHQLRAEQKEKEMRQSESVFG